MKIQPVLRFALTAVVVVVAALVANALWQHYMYSPWTRDGRVRAEIVRIAPDVSGLVIDVAVKDNQTVRKGDVLFTIDQARYEFALAQAQANLLAAEANARAAGANINAAQAGAEVRKANFDMALAQSTRRQKIPGSAISVEDRENSATTANSAKAGWQQAQATQQQATAGQDQASAAVDQARVAVSTAKLNLERTQVRAPVDGYVTNLDVRKGDYAAAGSPRMALIDSHSYWLYGYFEETKLPYMHVGDPVDIRLLSGGPHLKGTIESIARGITDADNPTGKDLLADVNPTFNWVRLAQRVPVRVRIDADHLPEGMILAAGMTATIIVHPDERARR
jgi:multidrug resistance efflux pump